MILFKTEKVSLEPGREGALLIPNIGSVICVRRYSVSPHLEILQMATQNDNLW